MQVWLYTLISVTIVSLLSLIGIITLSFGKNTLRKILLFMVSFAVGGLFGDAFIHLIPEAFKELGAGLPTALFIISGIFIFFILEKFVRWHHCHAPISESHVHPVVTLNFIGDCVHNMIDGMIIGASYTVSIPIGITTSLAVILHEIPHEIGNFSIFVHGGLSIRNALGLNLLSALTAIFGAIISLFIGAHVQGYTTILMPITAGGFLYIAGSDLTPELHHGCDTKISESVWQFICMAAGVGIMSLLILLD